MEFPNGITDEGIDNYYEKWLSEKDDNKKGWEIKNDKLGIHIYGRSFEEVVQNTIEEMAFLWDEYALEDDKNLTRDALDLKRTLHQTLMPTTQTAKLREGKGKP